MALKLGDLVTFLKTDDSHFKKGLAESKRRFKEHGEDLKTAGAAVGVAVGVAMAAGLTGAMELDKAKTKLAAQLGGDPAYAEEMGKVAGNVYARGFGESLEAVNETLRGVLTSGLVDEDATNAEIESVTLKAQALADVFGQDVTQMARAAGQMVKTGLAGDATEAFDIITRGFQQTGDHAGDALDTVTEYAVQFQKMGMDGATATGLINQGLKAGARDADKVADAVKEFSVRAVDGSKGVSDAFKALGLDADKMAADVAAGGPRAAGAFDTVLNKMREIGPNSVTVQQAMQGLFGGPGEDLGAALFALDVDKAAASLGDLEGAADKVGDTLEQSAGQQLEAFKRQAQSALVEKLAEAIPLLQGVAGWVQQNSAWLGPLVTVLGSLAVVVGVIIGVYKAWIMVQTALNIVMALNPITWIILAVVALIAVIVLIATKTTWFQTAWKWAWGGIKAAALAVGRWFRDTLWGKWIKGGWDGIVNHGSKVLAWFRSLPGKTAQALARLAGFITAPYRMAFNGIARLWNRTVGGFSFTIPSWVPGIGGNSFSLPRIPQLAKGGIVPATPGGRLVNVSEGGEDEAVIPLSKLAGLIGGGRSVLELRSSGNRVDDLLLELLRYAIKSKGGNVQVVLGQRGA